MRSVNGSRYIDPYAIVDTVATWADLPATAREGERRRVLNAVAGNGGRPFFVEFRGGEWWPEDWIVLNVQGRNQQTLTPGSAGAALVLPGTAWKIPPSGDWQLQGYGQITCYEAGTENLANWLTGTNVAMRQATGGGWQNFTLGTSGNTLVFPLAMALRGNTMYSNANGPAYTGVAGNLTMYAVALTRTNDISIYVTPPDLTRKFRLSYLRIEALKI